MNLVVKSFLKVRGQPEWLRSGTPGVFENGGGYGSVSELRKVMRSRHGDTHSITEIPNGVDIVPNDDYVRRCGCAYNRQEITLEG